ncbi:cell wall-active antibiotics response protein LiaF [Sporolactobacillus shoreicorticis]|uniref:Cell wall-active antibiotics response protein LiaF n=1 Tax=Sporolactobacillus shoreicorticis TaxID=1923877 RepID=A0ABW5S7F1_9BACL|nr:cell wall-active antibiotics response protein LiaF [Sporolactobacillus shoreicorticis]MCO7128277.1 cell wall-active antibiotics response protein LiaF [Sporolactobacillus shoreicorticis]
MFEQLKNDKYSWLIIICLFLIVLQTLFDGWGFLFPSVLFGAMIYYGRKNTNTRKGKILFWIGVIGLGFTIFSLLVFKFIIIALFICFVIDFIQRKKNPQRIMPDFDHPSAVKDKVTILSGLLKNKWFGHQETPGHDYEWQDINIQTGAGDTIIDLSHTILPKKESIIFIRHLAGRVRILVPYGVEVALHYSVVLGQVDFFDHHENQLIHESRILRSDGYDQAEQKVKLMVSAVAGSLEVLRV